MLTARQARFVEEFSLSGSPTAAAITFSDVRKNSVKQKQSDSP